MRMLMNVSFPHEPFNTMVRSGAVGSLMTKIMEAIKPEAVYLTERNGRRGATVVVNVDAASQIPALAEPFFLQFNADVEFAICMLPQDLQQSGLDELGKQWG